MEKSEIANILEMASVWVRRSMLAYACHLCDLCYQPVQPVLP